MVRLENINDSNYRQCLKLEVSEEQKRFVASNVFSLAQAYVSTVEESITALPYAVYGDDTMVGFVMLEYYEEKGEKVYEVGRMMIDKNYQGRGYGRAAMKLALDIIKSLPCGPARKITISYFPQNKCARALYLSLGFIETGEMEGDEVVAEMDL